MLLPSSTLTLSFPMAGSTPLCPVHEEEEDAEDGRVGGRRGRRCREPAEARTKRQPQSDLETEEEEADSVIV